LEDNEKGLMVQILRACSRRKLLAEGAIVRDKKLSPLSVIQPELDWIKTQKLGYLDKPFADWKDAQWNMAFDLMLRAQKRSDKVDKKPAEVPVLPPVVPAPAPQQDNSVLLQILEELQTLKKDSAELKRDVAELKQNRAPPSESDQDAFSSNFEDDAAPILSSPPTEEPQQPQPTSPFVVPEGRSTSRKMKRKTPVAQENPAKKPKSSSESEEGTQEPIDEAKEEQDGIISPPRLQKGKVTRHFTEKVWKFYAKTVKEHEEQSESEKKLSLEAIADLFVEDIEDELKQKENRKTALQVIKNRAGTEHTRDIMKNTTDVYLLARWAELHNK
jgi:vacuolar-type H+-ATPase subunit H